MAGGTKLADAYVQIIPVAEGITDKLKGLLGDLPEAGEEAGEKTGETLGTKLKGAIAKAGITAALGKVVKDAFSEGAQLEQSLGGVETLFKEHADIVKKNAEEAYRTAGLSANEYMQNVTSFSASLLQSLGGDTQEAAKVADMAMIDMSDNANKFGSDMQSIQNAYQGFAKQNYTMLDNLKLGYGGTKEEMERLLRDAEKFSGVKYDISNLDDVYKAIHVVQEKLDVTGTTAKEAGSTFSGSFASMQAAAKNFLGTLTTGGDVKKAFQNLEETAAVFMKNVLRMGKELISQALNLLKDAVADALENLGLPIKDAKIIAEGLKIALEGIAIAFVAIKTQAVMTSVMSSLGSLATKAMEIKNIIMSMGTGGVIGAIAVGVGLIANSIIKAKADAIDVTDNGIHDLTETTKAFADECAKTVGKVDKLHKELSETGSEAQSQANEYKTLINRLEELGSKTGRTAAEQAEFESIVKQLNGEIPGLNLVLDKQGNSIKNNTELVDKMVYAYGKMQVGEESQKKLAEATANVEETENAYAEAVERRNAAIQAGIDMNGDEMEALSDAVLSTHAAMETAKTDLEDIKTSLEDAAAAEQAFSSGFGDTNQYILNMSDETLEGINDICEKYKEAYQTQHDLVFGQMNLLDEFCGKSDVTKDQLQENLQSNIDGFTDWENNLAKLKQKVALGIISKDFYDNLAEMGPKGAGYAKAFVDMSDKELKEYSVKSKGIFDEMNDYVDRSMGKMKDESAQMLDDLIDLPGNKQDDLKEAYIMLGNYATEGYAEGIQNGSADMNEAVRKAIQDAIDTAKNTQDSHSPSRIFQKLGGYVSEGYALGIMDEASEAEKASENMVRQAIASANRTNEKIPVDAIRHEAVMSSPVKADSSAGMRSAFLEALAAYGSYGKSKSAPMQPIHITVEADGHVLGRTVVNDINRTTRRNGKSPLIGG